MHIYFSILKWLSKKSMLSVHPIEACSKPQFILHRRRSGRCQFSRATNWNLRMKIRSALRKLQWTYWRDFTGEITALDQWLMTLISKISKHSPFLYVSQRLSFRLIKEVGERNEKGYTITILRYLFFPFKMLFSIKILTLFTDIFATLEWQKCKLVQGYVLSKIQINSFNSLLFF